MFTGFFPGGGKDASFGQANMDFVEGTVSVLSSFRSGWRGVWRFLTAVSGVGSLAVISEAKVGQLWEPGLPAMAVGQVGNYRLIHRHRRQASSHRFSGVAGND